MNSNKDEISYQKSHLGKGQDYDQDILFAGNFDTYMASIEDKLLCKLIRKLFPNKVPKYLDFACGTGRIAKTVEKFAVKSTAIDVSESMLNEAKNKCVNTEFKICDITSDHVHLEPMNLITAFRFFGNAEDDLRNAILAKLSTVITDDGFLVINNHRNPYSLHGILLRLKGERPETDLSYWKLKRLLRSNGFEIRQTIGIGLWICTYRLRSVDWTNSTWSKLIEPISRFPLFGPICPDAIVIAQKV